MNIAMMGNYFEDFVVGATIIHSKSKTIFESDNNLFSLLTMNDHPIHTNIDYAETEQYGRVLVVGTLVFSLAVGFTVQDISGKAIANLGYDNIKHLAPVFINDTIYAQTTIISKRPSETKADRGIVEVETIVLNQYSQPVLSFSRTILVKRRTNG